MTMQSIQHAAAFVDGLELPPKPKPRSNRSGAQKSAPEVSTDSKQQAMVVGADIISFVAGTDPKLRSAIMNSSLLAQLAANRKVPLRDDVRSWYEAYFDILGQLGWIIQDRGFSEHGKTGDDFEANQAILSVATALLGASSTALMVVESTLESMKEMSKGPWMTIFQQESQTAKAARFQVTVAEPASHDGVVISLMAFELNTKINLTQVLFFKFRSVDVKLRHSSGRVAIDKNLLIDIAPRIAKRVADYVQSYVENIPI
jgi:hypothetical protein